MNAPDGHAPGETRSRRAYAPSLGRRAACEAPPTGVSPATTRRALPCGAEWQQLTLDEEISDWHQWFTGLTNQGDGA